MVQVPAATPVQSLAPASPAPAQEEAPVAPPEASAPVREEPTTEPEPMETAPPSPATPATPAAATPDPVPDAPARPAFGKRDPHERAQRLARVLVSDMIAYHPDRHRQSLENGTLADDFEEEIQKSWNEYVEQVGSELADSTDYFKDALNQILARGEPTFS